MSLLTNTRQGDGERSVCFQDAINCFSRARGTIEKILQEGLRARLYG